MHQLPVNFQSDQNYDCVRCGRGCEGHWNISVTEDKVQALRPTALVQKVIKEDGDPFTPVEGTKYHLRKKNGHCVFLEPGAGEFQGCQVCGIHAHIGYEAKPTTCKNFPFIVVETPEEVRVGASFYCTAVQQNVGRPLSVHTDAVEAFGTSERMHVGKKPIQVYEGLTTDWAGYKKVVEFLEHPASGESYESRLVRALLGMARVILSAQEGVSISADDIEEALQSAQPSLDTAEWFQILKTSCLHGITLYIECDETEEVQTVMAALFGGTEVFLPNILWKGPVQALLEFRETALPPELQAEADRYYRSILFRHYLGTHGSFFESLITLYLNANLIRQYSHLVA
ncbi:unnamed protein product, partial [Phaeothamnion confervicola]